MPEGESHLSALIRGGERYRTLLESLDEGFCVIQVLVGDDGVPCDYRFLEINAAFARDTGLQDVAGKRMRALASDHEAHWFEIYGRVALTGEPARFIQEARALDDRWYDVYAFRVDEPERRHVAVLFRDISARVRAEKSARLLSEISQHLLGINDEADLAPAIGAKIASHFHLSQCAFVEMIYEDGIAVVNNCWHRPEAPSLRGTHPLTDFLVADFWQQAEEGSTLQVSDVNHDDRIIEVERFERLQIGSFLGVPLLRDGRWRYLFMLYRRTPSAWTEEQIELAREIASRCWTRVDRLRAEGRLRTSEERLRLMLENARDYAIFSAGVDRRITGWNVGAERLLGYTEKEILGHSADLIFTPEDRRAGAPDLESTQALLYGRAADERWHLRKDGSRFWGSGVMMVMRDEHGAARGLLKIMRDQTEAQNAKQALEASQRDLLTALHATEEARAEAVAAGRAKDQFLAALSHELRTPLNPVLLIASEAAADPSLPEPVRADFEIVRKNIEHEARLIDDMLDLTRIVQGKLALHEIDVDLHQSVQAALEIVRSSAHEKRITPVLKLAARDTQVRGDPARLQQIVTNLLTNAIKFTAPGGEVRIETTNGEEPPLIVLRIVDTGIGLTSEELARVFQPFAQGSHAGESGSPMYGGLGLGLAIVEELTARHHGRVTAESAGPGRGAIFTVELPLARAPRAAAQEPEPSLPPPPPSAALKILLVEDHVHTRNALARLLERRGHLVTPADSKAAAIARAREQAFDLLISDIGLPDGEGYELLRKLRERHPELPGIALSGFGMESDLRRSSAAGFSLHLVKPVPSAKLDAAIAQLKLPASPP